MDVIDVKEDEAETITVTGRRPALIETVDILEACGVVSGRGEEWERRGVEEERVRITVKNYIRI